MGAASSTPSNMMADQGSKGAAADKLAPAPPSVPTVPAPPPGTVPAEQSSLVSIADDDNVGVFEDLHKKCKEIFPQVFEGGKLIINKGLSNHFQIAHTLTMSSLQPSGYKFGCTYVGNKQYTPTEAYPVLMGEIDPSGNLNANIIHSFTRQLRCKFVAQIQNHKWVATQVTSDFRGEDFTASFTLGNPDLVNDSGVAVLQYLQKVSKRVAIGSELLCQRGATIPGGQISIYTLAGRYSADDWQLSGSLVPAMGGVHLCYYHRANESLQVGVELEGSLRTQECTATLGYQLELAKANMTFKGQLDSNFCVGAVLEKKLLPLPFTFALSGFCNHVKGAYRFGIGLIVG